MTEAQWRIPISLLCQRESGKTINQGSSSPERFIFQTLSYLTVNFFKQKWKKKMSQSKTFHLCQFCRNSKVPLLIFLETLNYLLNNLSYIIKLSIPGSSVDFPDLHQQIHLHPQIYRKTISPTLASLLVIKPGVQYSQCLLEPVSLNSEITPNLYI